MTIDRDKLSKQDIKNMISALELRHKKALTTKETEYVRAKEAPEPLSPPGKTQGHITQAKLNA